MCHIAANPDSNRLRGNTRVEKQTALRHIEVVARDRAAASGYVINHYGLCTGRGKADYEGSYCRVERRVAFSDRNIINGNRRRRIVISNVDHSGPITNSSVQSTG